MPNERTPLIATVRVGEPRQRYPHNVVRRFCTVALSSTLIFFVTVFLVTVVFDTGHDHHHRHNGQWPGWKKRRVDYEELKEILLATPSSEMAEMSSKYYTSGPHLAGQNYSQVRALLPILSPGGKTKPGYPVRQQPYLDSCRQTEQKSAGKSGASDLKSSHTTSI